MVDEDLESRLSRILQPRAGQLSDAYGLRNTTEAVDQVRRAVAGVLLSDPEVLFEVAALARDRLLLNLADLRAVWARLSDDLAAAVRPFTRPRSTAALQVALQKIQQLEASPGSLSVGTQNYAQFRALTRRFLQEEMGAARYDGRIVAAPRELRRQLSELAVGLDAATAELERLAGVLTRLLSDGLSPRVLQQSSSYTLRKTRQLVQKSYDELAADPQTDNLEDIARNLVTALAVTEALASPAQLLELYPLTGEARAEPNSDEYPGTNAILVSELHGPYEVRELISLTVTVNTVPETALVPTSVLPRLDGSTQEVWSPETAVEGVVGPYDFTGATQLQIYYEASDNSRYDATVSFPEITMAIDQVVDWLNDFWSGLGIGASLQASDNAGAIRITALTGSFAIGTGTANAVLGLTGLGGFELTDAGATVLESVDGPFNTLTAQLLSISFFEPSTSAGVVLEVDLPAGPAVTAATLAALLQSELVARGLDAYYLATTLGPRLAIYANASSVNFFTVLNCDSLSLFGFTAGTVVRGKDNTRTLAFDRDGAPVSVTLPAGRYSAESLRDALQTALGSSYGVQMAGAPGSRTVVLQYKGVGASASRLRAQSSPRTMAFYLGMILDQYIGGQRLQASLIASVLNQQLTRCTVSPYAVVRETWGVRMQPNAPFQAYLYAYQGEGALEALGSTTLRLSPRPAGMLLNDFIRITSGPLAGSLWEVTELEASSFKAVSALQPIAGSVTWEGGTPTIAQEGWKLRVSEGLLEGDWQIDSVNDELRVTLTGSPPALLLSGASLTGSCTIGPDGVQFQATQYGPLTVEGGSLFFASLPTSTRTAQPTTSWLRLPSESRAYPGDVLEFYASGGLTPSSTTLIGRVEEDGEVVQTEASRPATFTFPMILDPTQVRCQIRSSRYVELRSLIREVTGWLSFSSERKRVAQKARSLFAQTIARVDAPPVQLLTARQKIAEVLTDLELLKGVLESYSPQPDVLAERVRALLLNRGYALLEEHWSTGDIQQLFSDSPDRAGQAFSKLKAVYQQYMEQDPEEVSPDGAFQTVVPDEEDEDVLYPEDEDAYEGGATIDD